MKGTTTSARRRAIATARALRESPYRAEFDASRAVAWGARDRVPRDLRQAVRIVRAAWINEVPTVVTHHVDALAPDGTPAFMPEAEAFIFEPPDRLESDDRDAVLRYRLTPFRATLHQFEQGDEKMQHQAAMVRRMTAGEQLPGAAAIAEGVPGWAAKDVAEQALRTFLGSMSDVVVREAPRSDN